MLSFSDVPYPDIVTLLTTYGQEIPNDKLRAYRSAWDLLNDYNIPKVPVSIADFIVALGLSSQNITMKTTSEILFASDDELADLTRMLTLPEVDKERTIRILGYLGKLDNDKNVFDILPKSKIPVGSV